MYRAGIWSAGALLLVFAGAAAAGDVIADLDEVTGIEQFRGTDAEKQLLKQNGFVVTPWYYHRIFGPYLDSELPPYITADSVHRTFHVIFEDALQASEENARGMMSAVAAELLAALDKAPESDARTLALRYFQVADGLLRDGQAPEDAVGAARELALIRGAAGISRSPLFGYELDYSQFKPRGFYTKTPTLRSYFRAQSWFGMAAFRQQSGIETRAAMIVADAFRQCLEARKKWNELDRLYTALLGECDDLTVEEYACALEGLDAALPEAERFAAFQAAVQALRDPQYNDMPIVLEQHTEFAALTKGMRFMGRRYLPDGGAIAAVTDPNVPGRYFPTALDVLAANGSERAKTHLANIESNAAYPEGLAKAADTLKEYKASHKDTHYVQMLEVMEALTAPPIEAAPAFVKTDAYADKNLTTAAAAWASGRHAWVLHAKQKDMKSICARRIPEPLDGYIEPNPEFFKRMLRLSETSNKLFSGLKPEKAQSLHDFGDFLIQLSPILDAQLSGSDYPPESKRFFNSYGERLIALQGNDLESPADRLFPWMALVADLLSKSDSGICFEVATGGAMPIYIAMKHEGNQYLFKGAVYSYYEFWQPINERLTDEAWRARWDVGDIPAPPLWTASYLGGGPNADEIVERLRNREIVPEAAFINDPRLDEILLTVLRDGKGDLSPTSSFAEVQSLLFFKWARELAVIKIPEAAKTIFFEQLREMHCPDFRYCKAYLSPFFDIGYLLASAYTESDMETLWQIAKEGGPNRASAMIVATLASNEKSAEDLWLRIGKEFDEQGVRKQLMLALRRASIDVTPGLLEMVWDKEGRVDKDILTALAQIWAGAGEPWESIQEPYETGASIEEIETWKNTLRPVITAYFAQAPEKPEGMGFDPMQSESSIVRLAILVGVDNLSERVRTMVTNGQLEAGELARPLVHNPSEEGAKILMALLPEAEGYDVYTIIGALGELKYKSAIPVLRSYLKNTSDTNYNGLRYCDHASQALDRILGLEPGIEYSLPFEGDRSKELAVLDAHRKELLELTEQYVTPGESTQDDAAR